jgi:uncharacterized protein YfeS
VAIKREQVQVDDPTQCTPSPFAISSWKRHQEMLMMKMVETTTADDDDSAVDGQSFPQYIIHGVEGYEYHSKKWKAASTISCGMGRLWNNYSSTEQQNTIEPSAFPQTTLENVSCVKYLWLERTQSCIP